MLRDVVVERLHTRQSGMALDCRGLPGAPIDGITLDDCRFDAVTRPSRIANTDRLLLDRARVDGARVPTLESLQRG